MRRTSTVTINLASPPDYQVALKDIPTGNFCLYRGHLCLVGYNSLIYVGEKHKELTICDGDFGWLHLCTPVNVTLNYSVVTG